MNQRHLYWSLFLGTSAVVALLPEFWSDPTAAPVQPVAPAARPAPATPKAAPQLAPRLAPLALAPVSIDRKSSLVSDTPAPSILIPAEQPVAAKAGGTVKDIFAAKSWAPPPKPLPPPPAPPPPPPPPPPAAPPLPFKFLGKLDDASSLKAFLNRGDKVIVVSVGEVIDNTYRVESIKAGQMTLIYLPLNVSQTLLVGSPL